MLLFGIYILTLLSAAFSLGGVTALYLSYHTRLLKEILLFLLSLLFVAAGFSLMWFPSSLPSPARSLIWVLHICGNILNIAVIPYLTAAICGVGIHPLFRKLHALLLGALLLLGVLFFLFPGQPAIQMQLLAAQLIAIAGGVLFIGLRLRRLRKIWWYPAVRLFFVVSLLFLALLLLDISITLVPLPGLQGLDNLSLPLYLLFLNVGIFFFSHRYLSREALLSGHKVTAACIEYYNLTGRETELIEALVQGWSNREIAERLCISVKTVENHLYNIYQKFGLGSRNQLIHLLWENS